jgi:hypothetical protein
MRSIVVTFALKDDLFNNISILGRDCDNIIKIVRERNPHPLADKHLY